MRVVKEAEERKNEILDVAERLFASKGFDRTSTNDILAEIGIARGTLYYHFQSKEEILDAMVERMTDRLARKAKDLAGRKEIPVLQRLTMMIKSLHVSDEWENGIKEQMHKPQNALMHQKMQERLLATMTPLITGLIEEGIAQGICQTDYPAEVAEMTFLYAGTVFDDLMVHDEAEWQKKTAAFIYNLERLLKMEEGSMQEAINPLFQA
ncbi:MAG: TetR/AcrR family transcriptional regulator [Lachnospiraceae bacterium]|nr:TetR/AcrR family transcriptional regulator [Lachnospiraceae bacterium]